MAHHLDVMSRGLDLEAAAKRFARVRERTDRLTAPLSPEDQMVQSIDDVSPTKWHRAHTTWFFAEFVLGADGSTGRSWDRPEYRFLYNSYYDAVGARHPRPNRGLVTRPTSTEVAEYRAAVDDAVDELFLSGRITPEQLGTLELGTHHEEQHQELMLIDIKHVLSLNPAVGPAYAARDIPSANDPGAMSFVGFEGGIVEIGVDSAGTAGPSGFSFDHEGPRHEVRLYDYSLADRLVTAGEWIEFISDGGYQRPEFWKSDGWYCAQNERWCAPMYWRHNPDAIDQWWVHTLTGLRDVDPHEPVCHVSHYEADAFASWSGARLPTEFEWEHAANSAVEAGPHGQLTGRFLDEQDPNFSFHPAAASTSSGAADLRQLFGDAWEWTSSAFAPYHGFATADGAIGEYNGKFMSGQHVLRGGGALTPPGHARVTYRNFFHPHTRWHLGGLRLAKDED
jgi:ergothioneine biosynthesis protein EgtB